jgi:hypothetical protein
MFFDKTEHSVIALPVCKKKHRLQSFAAWQYLSDSTSNKEDMFIATQSRE